MPDFGSLEKKGVKPGRSVEIRRALTSSLLRIDHKTSTTFKDLHHLGGMQSWLRIFVPSKLPQIGLDVSGWTVLLSSCYKPCSIIIALLNYEDNCFFFSKKTTEKILCRAPNNLLRCDLPLNNSSPYHFAKLVPSMLSLPLYHLFSSQIGHKKIVLHFIVFPEIRNRKEKGPLWHMCPTRNLLLISFPWKYDEG